MHRHHEETGKRYPTEEDGQAADESNFALNEEPAGKQ
jgi:hypothetical protein